MTDLGIAPPAEVAGPAPSARVLARRNPWLAALAAYVAPALGHLYAGRPRRGLAAYLGFLAGTTLFLWLSMVAPTPALRLLCLLAAGAPKLAMLVDAALAARRAPVPFVARRYNRAWVYVAVLLAGAAWARVVKAALLANVAHAWKVGGAAMAPTLVPGDLVLFAPRGAVHRGDVVAHRTPGGGEGVHRVVGVPGDTLQMRAGVLYRDGRRVREPYAYDAGGHDVVDPAMAWQRGAYVGADRDAYRPTFGDWGPLAVPAGRYFVLGDNRASSYDSRFFGFVAADDVVGRGGWIYLSRDPVTGFRWARAGRAVR